jgi:hypothetical protein
MANDSSSWTREDGFETREAVEIDERSIRRHKLDTGALFETGEEGRKVVFEDRGKVSVGTGGGPSRHHSDLRRELKPKGQLQEEN